jgi:hypothetical protein
VHDALHLVEAANEVAFVTKNPLALRDAHSSKEAQTMPFKSVQSPSMEPQQQQQKLGSGSSSSEETKKKQTGLSAIVSATAPLRPSAQQHPQQQQPGSVMNGSGSIFSFNSTHSVRGGADCSSAAETYDYDSNFDKDSSASFDFNRGGGGGGGVGGAYGPRAAAAAAAAVGPLLKPTPSKWDDAEKWLSASCDQAPGLMNAKAAATAGGTTITTTIKSKSGPWQSAHVVAANQQQGGGGVTSKKVTFSNLGAAERQQSGTQNGSTTTHLLPKATNAVADDHYGPGGDASASSSSSSSSSCENIGAAKYMRNKEEEGSGSGSSSEVEEAEAAIQEDSGTVAPDEAARFAFMPGVAATQGGPMTGGAVDRYPLNDPHGRDHHHHHGDGEEALRLNMSTDTTDDKAPALLLLRTAKPISESATGSSSSWAAHCRDPPKLCLFFFVIILSFDSAFS